MPATKIILVEATPSRVADGVAETVRLAGGGADQPYYYDGQHWRAGIVRLPTMIAALNFEGGEIGSGAVPQATIIEWAPFRASDLAAMANYFWPDATITVRIGPEGASPPTVLSGKVLDAPVEGGTLKLQLSDPAATLKKPLLTARYGGGGGVDGPAEWDGKIKRRIWGRVWNLAGEPIDKANNIYAYADLSRPLQAIDTVYDKGAATASLNQLAWQGSIAATFAALQAAVAPAGGGVAAPSIACVKWWTSPSGELTADLRGEVGTGYVETAPEIAERIAIAQGGPAMAAGTVAAAKLLRPAVVGWVAKDDSTTGAAMMEQLLADSSLMWQLNSSGQIVIRAWAWGASVATAVSDQVVRRQVIRPLSTRKLGWRRNETQMARGDIAAAVLAGDVRYSTGQSVDSLKPAEAGANVTETRTAAAIAGQAATATSSDFAVITGSTKPANNATRNIVTYSAGAPATPVDGDLWVDTSGTYAVFKLRSGGAWVTGANALTAYNALAGKPVALADINTTESSKLAGIEAGANVTETRTAAAVVGQSAWTTYTALTPQQVAQIVPNMVYNPTGVLGMDRWTVNSGAVYGQKGNYSEGYYFYTSSGGNAAPVAFYQDVPVAAGTGYTISGEVFAGGVSASSGSVMVRIYIQWINGAGASLGYSVAPGAAGGQGWIHVAAAGQVAPASTVLARVWCDVWGTGAYSITSAAWSKVKLQQGNIDTIFTDDASYGARYTSGVSIEALKPAEAGANVTETRTAAAIAGQGDLATTNRASLAFGDNAIVNSDFTAGGGLNNWSPPGAPCTGWLNLSGWFGKRNVVWWNYPATLSGAWYDFAQAGIWGGAGMAAQRRNGMVVKQGDNLYARARLAVHRCLGQVYILIFDSAGTLIEAPQWTGGRADGAANGDPANFDVVGGTYVVTSANAATAQFMVRMLGNGGGNPYVFMTEPAMGIIPAGQTVLPPYKPGREDPAADQTSTNVAAAIIGQGAGATANSLAQLDATAAAQLASLAAGASQVATYGSVIRIRLAAGASANFNGRVSVDGGGTTFGTIRCLLQSSPSGANTFSTFATGAGATAGPGEPGADTVSGTFTNSTGVEQVFDFKVEVGRTPGSAGGTAIISRTYIAI